MEYQGISNWDNLLDPLDNNLRSEILRYGHFVEAAYKSYTTNNNLSYLNGYKVTKLLKATSGIKLPPWVVTTRSSNIGYIAICDDEQEIERLGRRDVVVAFRGTITCLEWLENLRANLTHISNQDHHGGGAMVESGFLSLYTSASASDGSLSLQQMVREEIHRILQIYDGQPLSLTFTGHSLGAALATLTAYDMAAVFGVGGRMVTVVSMGGPRVGDRRFREEVEGKGMKVLRIVNSEDVITKVPGFVFDDVAARQGVHVAWWVKEMLEDAKLTYAEVGKELRLCSKDSPYLRGMDVATCHDLNTYLHLIDGFVSSTCPFNATTKKYLRE